jgi:hypothetical protein
MGFLDEMRKETSMPTATGAFSGYAWQARIDGPYHLPIIPPSFWFHLPLTSILR